MNMAESVSEHAQTAAHSPGSDGDGMASHSTAHHHSGRPLSLSQLSAPSTSKGAAAATAGNTTSTNEKAKGKDTGKGGDDQEKKE